MLCTSSSTRKKLQKEKVWTHFSVATKKEVEIDFLNSLGFFKFLNIVYFLGFNMVFLRCVKCSILCCVCMLSKINYQRKVNSCREANLFIIKVVVMLFWIKLTVIYFRIISGYFIKRYWSRRWKTWFLLIIMLFHPFAYINI